MIKAIKAVIFDLDGTLLNTLDDLADAGNYTLAKLGYPLHKVCEYKYFVGNGIPKLIERMLPANVGDDIKKQALGIFMEHYAMHSEDKTSAYSGISELLTGLKQRKLKLGVLTNKADSIAVSVVEKYFCGMFDVVHGLSDNVLPKPDTKLALQIAAQLGVRAEEVFYVGDSGVDMQTAVNAGFTPCGVLWGFRTRDELLENGSKFIVEQPVDILELIK